MSRSGYEDDDDNWALIRWRGAVNSAMRGRRGQRLLRELRDALDAMPNKRLIAGDLESHGEVCALGAVGKKRGIDVSRLDPEDSYTVARLFDIADALAREVVYINDEEGPLRETPEHRWQRVRRWVDSRLEGEE